MGAHDEDRCCMATTTPSPSSMAKRAICRQTPEVGAVCPNRARTDLCGGRRAISVPTAIPPAGYVGGLEEGGTGQLQKREPQEADDLKVLPVAFNAKGHRRAAQLDVGGVGLLLPPGQRCRAPTGECRTPSGFESCSGFSASVLGACRPGGVLSHSRFVISSPSRFAYAHSRHRRIAVAPMAVRTSASIFDSAAANASRAQSASLPGPGIKIRCSYSHARAISMSSSRCAA